MKLRKTRIAVDVMLTAMLIFEMLYSFTGNLLHEVVGLLFFVTLIIHMVLSFRWIKAIGAKASAKQSVSLRKKMMLIMCGVIAVVGVLLMTSSLLISNVLESVTGWQLTGTAYQTIAYLHTLLAYLLCGSAVVHVALHWAALFNVMKIPYDAGKRNAINVGISSVAAIGVIALGSTAARALDAFSESAASDPASKSSASEQPLNPQGSSEASKARQQREMGSGSTSQQGAGNNESSTSGYCTLCHKQCSLLAPKCNKPYAAGLL